jgi:hypothetical protein
MNRRCQEEFSPEAKAVDVTPSLGLTTLLPSAAAGNAQKTTKPVKKARGMILLVDLVRSRRSPLRGDAVDFRRGKPVNANFGRVAHLNICRINNCNSDLLHLTSAS